MVLSRTFSYADGMWRPEDNAPEAYRKIKKSVKIGELTFDLSLNFDFYLDSRLIHSADTPQL
ncbi:MAG: hypothetical protein Q4A64_04675 [Porphyromonadaceae bacterium]|nr:hypothetical protein [Porphyromonadaceae bacterium]